MAIFFVLLVISSLNFHDAKVGDFYNGGLWGNVSFFVGPNINFVLGYITNVVIHHERFSSKKQVIKKVVVKKAFDKLI